MLSSALSSDSSGGAVVSKIELARLLGTTRQTLDNWIAKYGADFPVLERGSNGVAYRFDASAVIDFLRTRQAEQEASKAERDEQLAQLLLPLPPRAQPAPGVISIDEQLKAERLNAMRLEAARKAGELVRAAEVLDALATAFAALGRNQAAFARALGREHGWPEPVVLSVENRLAEMQRAAVRDATSALLPADQREESRLALG